MTPKQKRRFALVSFVVIGVGVATALVLKAFDQNLLFFFTPAQVAAGEAPPDHSFRMGGLVVDGSVQREKGSLTVQFDLTDTLDVVTVRYTGILPDLFREGQGIVARGKLGGDRVFVADEVLAKHDENYMPPEVADALQAAKIKGAVMPESHTQ
ncbi:MAG: cytochrome c maturation protein CcmE [Gammaproteobacteria bacterium]